MVFCRDREFSVATEFAQARVATEILCRNRAYDWDGGGTCDRAPLVRTARATTRNSAH